MLLMALLGFLEGEEGALAKVKMKFWAAIKVHICSAWGTQDIIMIWMILTMRAMKRKYGLTYAVWQNSPL